jgi:hypothetical protein
MLVSTSSGFVFFHIPKTGGIAVRKTLEQYKDIGPDDYSKSIHWKKNTRRVFDIFHINQPEANKLYDLTDLIEFTVVREPLQRLISLYNHGKISVMFDTFNEFMKVVAKHYDTPNIFRELFNSQLYWITDKTIILKLEDIIKDPAKEFAKVNINVSLLEKANENTKTKYFPTMTEIEFCLDFLSEEYEKLGYEKPTSFERMMCE